MMEKLGFILPVELQMLLVKKNSLLGDITKVQNMVNAYNSFIFSMNNLEVSFHTYTMDIMLISNINISDF